MEDPLDFSMLENKPKWKTGEFDSELADHSTVSVDSFILPRVNDVSRLASKWPRANYKLSYGGTLTRACHTKSSSKPAGLPYCDSRALQLFKLYEHCCKLALVT